MQLSWRLCCVTALLYPADIVHAVALRYQISLVKEKNHRTLFAKFAVADFYLQMQSLCLIGELIEVVRHRVSLTVHAGAQRRYSPNLRSRHVAGSQCLH